MASYLRRKDRYSRIYDSFEIKDSRSKCESGNERAMYVCLKYTILVGIYMASIGKASSALTLLSERCLGQRYRILMFVTHDPVVIVAPRETGGSREQLKSSNVLQRVDLPVATQLLKFVSYLSYNSYSGSLSLVSLCLAGNHSIVNSLLPSDPVLERTTIW